MDVCTIDLNYLIFIQLFQSQGLGQLVWARGDVPPQGEQAAFQSTTRETITVSNPR